MEGQQAEASSRGCGGVGGVPAAERERGLRRKGRSSGPATEKPSKQRPEAAGRSAGLQGEHSGAAAAVADRVVERCVTAPPHLLPRHLASAITP